jgi:hypothetical protein
VSLRLKLLLVALSTLALPWAGWRRAATESLLRQGQEQACSRRHRRWRKRSRHLMPKPRGPVLVCTGSKPVVVDSYADDVTFARTRRRSGPRATRKKRSPEHARTFYLFADVRCDARAPTRRSARHTKRSHRSRARARR